MWEDRALRVRLAYSLSFYPVFAQLEHVEIASLREGRSGARRNEVSEPARSAAMSPTVRHSRQDKVGTVTEISDTGHPLGCGDPVTDIVRDVQRKRFAQGAVFGSDPTPASRATTGVDETWSVQQSDSLGIRPIQFKYHCMRNRRFVRICYTRSSHACVHCERAMEKTF